MVVGPCWKDSQAPPVSPELLIAQVRGAAGRLVADLHQAERWTDGWQNEPLGVAVVDVAMSKFLAKLAHTGCWGRANQIPSEEIWEVAGRLLEVGSLQLRARTKPRGYDGDYEMLTRICQNKRCDHPLGRLFDSFFLSQAAPRAVANRTEQIGRSLVSHCLASRRKPYRVVSVGSGPALDLELAVSLLPAERRKALHITLLDLDEEALEHAKAGLTQFVDPKQLQPMQVNLARLEKKPDTAAVFADVDFISCSGFFDYLAEEAAAAMLKFFWRSLADDGMLLVGNFAAHCPTRAYMEWIGNWYLQYRTPEAMEAIGRAASLPDGRWDVCAERSGVNLFFSACKASSTAVPRPHFLPKAASRNSAA